MLVRYIIVKKSVLPNAEFNSRPTLLLKFSRGGFRDNNQSIIPLDHPFQYLVR